jgi:hypothetical protein
MLVFRAADILLKGALAWVWNMCLNITCEIPVDAQPCRNPVDLTPLMMQHCRCQNYSSRRSLMEAL